MSSKTLHIANQTTTCYHCGEQCVDEILYAEDKPFCCTGCKLVYEVLNENDLCTYYEIENQPGKRQKISTSGDNRFDYLEDEDVTAKLLDFKNDELSHVTFNIPLIHCASCIWLLENLHKINPAILSGRVDFIRKNVQVKFNHQEISLREVVVLLSSIGYEPRLNLSDVEGKKGRSTVDRRLIKKLAVAGFCFGNMMLFSLPEYFSEAELLGNGFKKTFNYLNVLLSLPVFFYAATDYYKSAWLSIKGRNVNMDVPIAIGIVTLFLYSLYDIFMLHQEGYMDTLGGLLFFLLIGKLYQQKTYDTLSFDRDYKSYFPVAVTKVVKDREEVIPLGKLKVGDLIKVRHGELIPADSILISGDGYVDYSFVTGEEVPVVKGKGSLVYAGGRQKGQSLTMAVQKSPSQGYLTGLWDTDSFQKEKDHSLISLATKISGKFTFTVLLIAVLSFGYWMSQGQLSIAILSFTSVLIITCPCALAMSTPFTLGNTLRVFGQGKFYLKNAQVLEKMAEVDAIIFDKTGTLTDPNQAKVDYQGEGLSLVSKGILKALVSESTHALSNRINVWLGEVKKAKLTDIEEFFGKGLQGKYHNQLIRLGSAEFVGAYAAWPLNEGNRVYFSVEGVVLGCFYIQSGLRSGVENAMDKVKIDRYIHLLSGDQDHERFQLQKLLGTDVSMKFNQSPTDKLNYIKSINQKGFTTMMVGDGLNDAGALQESHVGVAVTDKVTNFSPASDAIIDASVLEKLADFLSFSKLSRKIIKASFMLSFAYNILGIFFAVQGLVSPVFCAILMPISSISVILFTTISTNYMAYRRGLKTKIF
ncbi:heavy metal translocating P-type ATPase [Belliella kenyensis]|uniref:Heavy metal translocating P-type ATPase n=1 Tax=Belliella kenyensis TaxID=1472724 RepID=A0ABV8EN28_9BACT|nr:heavy metal translocating P-type ATPase metal-binding domain-containing protein [Belliella kenyensis]MCH7400666.1 heavy metal translocating P-type ATPase metal-binding domain-containing protein [Belliella kenyensis]MDN3602047.1 heavy metal translocating P-type ATPase metal-binding domain-containing protein [Belliella kenyensis]